MRRLQFYFWAHGRTPPDALGTPPPNLKLEQPFSLKAALKFGIIFLALNIAGVLAQRTLGVFGFYAVSVAGGLPVLLRLQRLALQQHTTTFNSGLLELALSWLL